MWDWSRLTISVNVNRFRIQGLFFVLLPTFAFDPDTTALTQEGTCGRWITTNRTAVSGFSVLNALHCKSMDKNFPPPHCSVIQLPAFPIGRDDDEDKMKSGQIVHGERWREKQLKGLKICNWYSVRTPFFFHLRCLLGPLPLLTSGLTQ